MQYYEIARDRVLCEIKQYDPKLYGVVKDFYSGLSNVNGRSAADNDFEEATTKADGVVSLLERHRESLLSFSSARPFRDILQMSRIVAQAARMRTAGAGSTYRERMMAKNVEWLLNHAYPGEKIVLWAHNVHVSAASGGVRPMGSWLRELLGPQMYVVGFGIHTGSVRATTTEKRTCIGLADNDIPPSDPGTGTAILSSVGEPLFFLDLRNREGEFGKWLFEPHLFRMCGSIWGRDKPEAFMNSESLAQSYDGLIFLENSHAAHGIRSRGIL